MDVYKINDIGEIIKNNSYLGRGIIIGKSNDGKNAVCSYFIMGRSSNSRNRIFSFKDNVLYTEPLDKNKIIITNGNQTDTIFNGLKDKISFEESLKSRKFEPDSPHFTPRISGLLCFKDNDFDYKISILKSANKEGDACYRYTFDYESVCGIGHFIHTYLQDNNPLPSFYGEPKKIEILNDIDEFTNKIWKSLNEDNKISIFSRYTNLKTGEKIDRIINKYKL